MKYTVRDFNAQFENDAACLEFIWQTRFPKGLTCKCGKADSFHRCVSRRCYSCAWCGQQVYPCEGTIFHKSRTSLKSWFFAMFLMSTSKNGVAAKELQRQLGVTYKTAWRMNHQIRKLMNQGEGFLSGIVEMDETRVGGRSYWMHKSARKARGIKQGRGTGIAVIGAVQRDGAARATVAEETSCVGIMPHLLADVAPGSELMTDEWIGYRHAKHVGYIHASVNHAIGEYVRAEVHTNTIEGFWGQLKRSINGTFHSVSRKHLQAYVNEFVYRYNRRKIGKVELPIFADLSARVAERHVAAA